MFKRLFWLCTGAGFGFGSSFWVMRAVRRQVDRLRPSRVVARLEGDVRAAVSEGREAMHEREAALRLVRSDGAARSRSRSRTRALTRGGSAGGPRSLTPAR
jgi:hypothetical protein